MSYLEKDKTLEIRAQARVLQEAMTGAVEPGDTGADWCALYVAAKSMADGFRAIIPADMIPELDETAELLTAERLAAIGLSTEGAN